MCCDPANRRAEYPQRDEGTGQAMCSQYRTVILVIGAGAVQRCTCAAFATPLPVCLPLQTLNLLILLRAQ